MQPISSVDNFSDTISSPSPSPIAPSPSPSPIKKEESSFFAKMKNLVSFKFEEIYCQSLLRKAGLTDEKQIELLTKEALGDGSTPCKVVGIYKNFSSYRFEFEEKNPETGRPRSDLIGIGKNDGKIYRQTHIEDFYPTPP